MAVLSFTESFNFSISTWPVLALYPISMIFNPAPFTYVLNTCTLAGGGVLEIIMLFLSSFMRAAIRAASPRELAQSYIDALDTSIPVSWHMNVWYSKSARRKPWLNSGWYWV